MPSTIHVMMCTMKVCRQHLSHVGVIISDIWFLMPALWEAAPREDMVLWHLQRLDVGAKLSHCAYECSSVCTCRSDCVQMRLFQVRFFSLPWELFFWVFCLVIGGEKLSKNEPKVLWRTERCKENHKLDFLHVIPPRSDGYNIFWYLCQNPLITA